MTDWPREFDDGNGRALEVGPSGPEGRCYLKARGKGGEAIAVCVDSPDILDLALAMWEASGTTPPVMLGRPAIPPRGDSVDFAGFSLWVGGGKVQYRTDGDGELDPSSARMLAAMVCALADSIPLRPEPDEAEVEELAKAIRHGIHPGGGRLGLGPTEADRTAAIVALKWMKDREADRA